MKKQEEEKMKAKAKEIELKKLKGRCSLCGSSIKETKDRNNKLSIANDHLFPIEFCKHIYHR